MTLSTHLMGREETVKTAVASAIMIARSTDDPARTTHEIIKNLLINYLVLFVKPDCFDAAVIDLAKCARNGIEKFQEMKVEDGVDQ